MCKFLVKHCYSNNCRLIANKRYVKCTNIPIELHTVSFIIYKFIKNQMIHTSKIIDMIVKKVLVQLLGIVPLREIRHIFKMAFYRLL